MPYKSNTLYILFYYFPKNEIRNRRIAKRAVIETTSAFVHPAPAPGHGLAWLARIGYACNCVCSAQTKTKSWTKGSIIIREATCWTMFGYSGGARDVTYGIGPLHASELYAEEPIAGSRQSSIVSVSSSPCQHVHPRARARDFLSALRINNFVIFLDVRAFHVIPQL